MEMKRKIIFFLLISAFSLAAQQKYVKKEIPHDTSFTLSNTAVKVHKDFPFAELVISKLPERITEETNIIYTSYGERKLHLDIFSVARKEKTLYPGVILIHGGGWRSGDRSMEIPMAHFLAKNGYVTATVEYRLSPEALYPAAIYDLKVAIKWMRANALKYNINKSKIAVYGCSSGGQLAALVGTTNGILKFEGEKEYQNYSSDVQAVVDIDGVLDMTDPNESGKDIDPNKPSAAKQWLGVSYRDNPDLWKEASAINHVDKKSAPGVMR